LSKVNMLIIIFVLVLASIFLFHSKNLLFERSKEVVAVVGFAITLFEYLRSVRDERVRSLLELHKRFMETAEYREIRRIIEIGDPVHLSLIKHLADKPDNPGLLEEKNKGVIEDFISKFDGYLSFMELLAHLWDKLHFKYEDIDGLFGYWIRDMSKHKEIRSYIDCPEYEYYGLSKLLVEFEARSISKKQKKPYRSFKLYK
jgi:hypothetical protein